MSLNELSLEKKLLNVTNSQDSIQSLSLWILHHKSLHKRIIQMWMNCFHRAKATHRLTLFYLANDVIQHAKRKNVPQFVDDFVEVIKEATILVKGDKISGSVERVFNIWLERNVYSEEFIDELRALLSGTSVHSAAISKIVAEFKLSELIDKIKKIKKVEQNSSAKLECLVSCKVDATSSEVLNKLKDKTHGEQFSKDFDDATKCLETVINALEKEVMVRTELVESLEKSEIFYETQKDEAKTVVDAYKNFGLRVKNVAKKLEESKNSLPSPLPSPPRDAPSPTNSDDGPNLPQNDLFTDTNAIFRQVSDDSKSSHQTSSLDQRLSSLIHSIPHVSDHQNNNNPNQFNTKQMTPIPINNQSLHSSQMQTISNHSIISDNNNSFANNNRWNTTTDYSMTRNTANDPNLVTNYASDPMFLSQQTNANNQMMYDYNYSHRMQDIQRQNNAEIQHIQALVSSRGEELKAQMNPLSVTPIVPSSNVMPPFHDYHSLQQPSENFEPADMDLGNSDEEELAINRLQTSHRTLKVIDTRRNSNETQLSDLIKVNNGPNDERLYNNNNINNNTMNSNSNNTVQYMPQSYPLSSPQLKSVARMPNRSSLNSAQHPQYHPSMHSPQWRTPRSAVIAPQHFSPNSMSMNAHSLHQNRNWRPQNTNSHNNRNNRKNNFRRNIY